MTRTCPARNRVTPDGDIIAAPGRGTWMGNRGQLHEGGGTRDIVRHQQSKAWLTCALSFRDRRVAQWQPGRYTPLFFLDEAVAFAAGHRPCAECRYRAFLAFATQLAGSAADGKRLRAAELDSRLHAERSRDPRGRRILAPLPWADLPDGTFVVTDTGMAVVVGDHLTRYERASNTYGARDSRPRVGTAAVLTPPSAIAVLRSGYQLQIADEAR